MSISTGAFSGVQKISKTAGTCRHGFVSLARLFSIILKYEKSLEIHNINHYYRRGGNYNHLISTNSHNFINILWNNKQHIQHGSAAECELCKAMSIWFWSQS